MGNCGSSQIPRRRSSRGEIEWRKSSTAKVIHVDGRLEKYGHTVRAGQVSGENPGCYVCSIEAMLVGSHVPQLPEAEELKPGQIYFLMPLSRSHLPLSLPDLCELAVKASAALGRCHSGAEPPYPPADGIYKVNMAIS